MAFESPIEKFLLVSFIVLALVAVEVSTGFFSHLFQPPAPKEKISASNYPNFIIKEEIPSEKLVLTYNPELAIVSPDRTPFIDLVLKIKNEQDVPRTLKLVFPDPATLLTDDPRFVVAHTTFKDENTDQTYHRLVLFLPEKAEKEVKIRYENAYAALDDLKHDVTLELYNEDDQKVADITYRLRSVVLGFWDVWALPTMPTDKKEIILWTGNPAFTKIDGRFIYWMWGSPRSDSTSTVKNVFSTEIPLGKVSGTLHFKYSAYRSDQAYTTIDYFRVKIYASGKWETILECRWPAGQKGSCDIIKGNLSDGWFSGEIKEAEKIKFEARLGGARGRIARIIVSDLYIEKSPSSWHTAYYKEGNTTTTCSSNSSNPCTAQVVLDIPDGKYRSLFVLFGDDMTDRAVCNFDWVRIEVFDGSQWIQKTELDAGSFCKSNKGRVAQPILVDVNDMDVITQVRVVWSYKGITNLYAKVYMIPYEFPNTVSFVELCDGATYTLQLKTNGEFGVLQLPQNSCTTLKKQTLNTVHIKATYESQTTELNLPVFYDPDKSDDLLWRIYEQWKNSLEVNSQ